MKEYKFSSKNVDSIDNKEQSSPINKFEKDRSQRFSVTSILEEKSPNYTKMVEKCPFYTELLKEQRREPSVTINRYPRELSISWTSYINENKREPSVTITRYPANLKSSWTSYTTIENQRRPSVTINKYPRNVSSSRLSYTKEDRREPSITYNRYNRDLSTSRTSYCSNVNEKSKKLVESKTSYRAPIYTQVITETWREPRISVTRYEKTPTRSSFTNKNISISDKIPVFTISEDPSPKQIDQKINLNETIKSNLRKNSFESSQNEKEKQPMISEYLKISKRRIKNKEKNKNKASIDYSQDNEFLISGKKLSWKNSSESFSSAEEKSFWTTSKSGRS